MSNEIDWSKAPEGATHYIPETEYLNAAWYKIADSRWVIWMVGKGYGWNYTMGLPSNAIARPVDWDGTGLPPVGTKCEYHSEQDGWIPCEVVAHRCNAGVVLDIHYCAELVVPKDFRPIRTTEQSAADKREKDVAEMQSHFKFNVGQRETLRAICFALHDAGYRKTEQEQDK